MFVVSLAVRVIWYVPGFTYRWSAIAWVAGYVCAGDPSPQSHVNQARFPFRSNDRVAFTVAFMKERLTLNTATGATFWSFTVAAEEVEPLRFRVSMTVRVIVKVPSAA